jgi:hypothetical protein
MSTFDSHQFTQLTENTFFSRGANTARVQHNKAGIFRASSRTIAHTLQCSFEPFRIRDIHLAPDRPDVIAPLTRCLITIRTGALVKEDNILHGAFTKRSPASHIQHFVAPLPAAIRGSGTHQNVAKHRP